ncbi:citrate lyase subunit alpha [Aerococcus urinaehominis]|uniref:Citrate lyase alpha chain n=1 Tax=Aerococcus urinaehominis TaxID=128944 RepID=A0A120IAP5_9LACT|nr:citrate lyase subunit alpha [Aerococcus urinaehominis]AMB98711.1 citrate lyase subunit alpha [Aerococcus urinaehominis]SDL99659.1 citrate lyase subunit alpha / citrate CoA-transferase [Aerococcus urinaehominis]
MKNAVNREIPDHLLGSDRQVYQGKYAKDGTYVQKASPRTRRHVKPEETKLCQSIREACERCGAHDGMTFSFHTEFRDGDYVASMVAKVLVEDMGLKDITVAATSLGQAQEVIADYIEAGKITGIQTSGVRGRVGEVISAGKLAQPAIIRSHGGRPRAVEAGEVQIDIAFLAAASADKYGNASGLGGKNNCGSMGFAIHDAYYADHTIIITDCLVDFPNLPASINAIDVDCVCLVDQIGDPSKISTKEARMTENPRELMMAENVAKVMAATPYFKDGFSFQTGVGGPSLAVTQFLEKDLRAKNIKMSFCLGGTSSAICHLQDQGLVDYILDTQDFDQGAIKHLASHPNHLEISLSEYANPANKGAYVNMLDFVVLSALEIDTDFNVNVVTGSDGVLRGAPGGHPDTAAGSKCCIIVTPLTRGRMATVCDLVVTVTTPGDCIDVLVTDYGIAVNPARPDLAESLTAAGIKHVPIQALRDKAYELVGQPDDLEFDDQVVAVVEARDGTILDVVKKVKPFSL